jgi:hypothetical protein
VIAGMLWIQKPDPQETIQNFTREDGSVPHIGDPHSLKGAIGVFGTGAVFQAAYRLQLQGRNGDLRHVEAKLIDLERLLVHLREDIQKLISA